MKKRVKIKKENNFYLLAFLAVGLFCALMLFGFSERESVSFSPKSVNTDGTTKEVIKCGDSKNLVSQGVGAKDGINKVCIGAYITSDDLDNRSLEDFSEEYLERVCYQGARDKALELSRREALEKCNMMDVPADVSCGSIWCGGLWNPNGRFAQCSPEVRGVSGCRIVEEQITNQGYPIYYGPATGRGECPQNYQQLICGARAIVRAEGDKEIYCKLPSVDECQAQQ